MELELERCFKEDSDLESTVEKTFLSQPPPNIVFFSLKMFLEFLARMAAVCSYSENYGKITVMFQLHSFHKKFPIVI